MVQKLRKKGQKEINTSCRKELAGRVAGGVELIKSVGME
jgi:hypothetical protein